MGQFFSALILRDAQERRNKYVHFVIYLFVHTRAHTYIFITLDPFIHTIAGGAAGGVSRTLTAPFERLKMFKQVRELSNIYAHQAGGGVQGQNIYQ